MPVINPKREGMNIPGVQLTEAGNVQLGQRSGDVPAEAVARASGRIKQGEALVSFMANAVNAVDQRLTKAAQSKAIKDELSGAADQTAADSIWTGAAYRQAYAQASMSHEIGSYVGSRSSLIQQDLANGKSYAEAMDADRKRLGSIGKRVSQGEAFMGQDFANQARKQLGTIMQQQNTEMAAQSAKDSVETAQNGLADMVYQAGEPGMMAIRNGDSGGFRAQKEQVFATIDAAAFMTPAERTRQKQMYFTSIGERATSGAELNRLMQEAQDSLGADAAPVLNRLESNRQKATLGERINLLSSLNEDNSSRTPEEQIELATQNDHTIQRMVQEGTLSPEQGWSYMKAQQVQMQKAQTQSLVSDYTTNGGDLGKVARAMGKSPETVYDNLMEGKSVLDKVGYAQLAQSHRDSTGFALAVKDIGKSMTSELRLLQSTPINQLSQDQVLTLAQMDVLKQQNPAMFDTILDGMGDDGAMLRTLAESGTINSTSLQAYQEHRRQAQALAGKDIGKKERDSMIQDAASAVNGRMAVNGEFLAGAFNRASWNDAALSEVSKDVMAGLSNEQITLGGKNLIAQRMADRTMQILLTTDGVRSSTVGAVTSENGVSISRTVQALGLANKEDLGNLISTRYKNLTDMYGSDADVMAPKLMRDGSLQLMVLNNASGESYPVTLSADQLSTQARQMMQARADGDDKYVKDEASVRPVVVGGKTVLMRGTDFTVGDSRIRGNWVASAGQELADQEGFSDKVYQDTGSTDTWGIGMTDASGVKPHEVATPQQAADKLQSLIQTNYGKTAVEALNKQNLPVDKSTFVLMTEIAYQSPQSAQQMATALGKYYRGETGTDAVYSALRETNAYTAGADRRKVMRENRLQHILESLDQARRAYRTNPNSPG